MIESPIQTTDEQLRGARVVVMGLGRFGGGVGVARFLTDRGADLLITDTASEDSLSRPLAELSGLPIRYRLGGHDVADLDDADLLIVSPAVNRTTSSFFRTAMERGVHWTTEMGMFIERCPARMAGVTGSIGKSTTCAMIDCILASPEATSEGGYARVHLGGNIGRSLLNELHAIGVDDVVILELSSFQLDALPVLKGRWPVVGITNITPHHLDRHGDFDSYIAAKLNLLRGVGDGGCVIVGRFADDVQERVGALVRQRSARLVMASEATELFELRVPGSHNQSNARFAALVAEQLGVSMASARRALTEFAGLPHRLQFVSVIEGVRYFNDSKSTSAEAVGTALRSFNEPVVLLCGGKDTGRELDRIADGPWETVRAVVCFGDAADRLMQMLTSLPADRRPSVVHTEKTVDRAVSKARSIAQPGDVVLLSPGCPSYDAFCNYEERGDAFVAKVKSLASLDPAPI